MNKLSGKSAKRLEVKIMFEPNRLQDSSLHTAYNWLVPVLRGRLLTTTALLEASSEGRAPVKERKMS